jgi:hypothetical protein
VLAVVAHKKGAAVRPLLHSSDSSRHGTCASMNITDNHSRTRLKKLLVNITFESKVALVTGAGSGLGLPTAKAFASSGVSVTGGPG